MKEIEPELMYFSPEEIIIDDNINARPYSTAAGDTEDEKLAIEQLAASIKHDGQQQPIKVRLDGEGKPHLIMGRRRTHAVALVNLDAEEPLKVMAVAVSDEPDGQALKEAIIENLHRRGMSPMDMLMNIQKIRADHKWEGVKGTKKVAEYLHVSPAQVTQHEKLGKLQPEFQKKVHAGELTAQAAFDLADIPAEKRDETLKKAVEIKKDEIQKATVVTGVGKGGGVKKTKAVGSKHIRKAARQQDDPSLKKPLNKAEILDFFNDYYGANPELYGYPDSPLQVFLAYFLEEFVKGRGSARTLDKHWMKLLGKIELGTKPEPTVDGKANGKKKKKAA